MTCLRSIYGDNCQCDACQATEANRDMTDFMVYEWAAEKEADLRERGVREVVTERGVLEVTA